jgi:hypothetical protein
MSAPSHTVETDEQPVRRPQSGLWRQRRAIGPRGGLRRCLVSILVSGALLICTVATAAPQPFGADSFRQILSAHAGQPLLVVLWSVDCPPCHQELAALGALRKEHGELPLVLISTDDQLPSADIQAVLERHGLGGANSWQFADPVPAKLRRAIDPGWYGELPRSYLIDAKGARHSHSGMLDATALQQLLPLLR